MSERISKTRKFLEGRRIVEVCHEPNSLVLILDDGHRFRATAGLHDFDRPALDFLFDDRFGREGR